jgi:hypothetical protein
MIDLVLLTSTPAAARTFLTGRGLARVEDGQLVGTKPGFEYAEVPNPVQTTAGDEETPPVMDTRRCFLIRLTHQMAEDDDDGTVPDPEEPDPREVRSRLVKWILANSVATTIVSADGRSWPARRVGSTVWFMRDRGEFGVWQ